MKEKDLYDWKWEDYIQYGLTAAIEGTGRQVLYNYMETVRTWGIHRGLIKGETIRDKWQVKWEAMKRICGKNMPRKAPVILDRMFKRLTRKTRKWINWMAAMGARYSTVKAMKDSHILTEIQDREGKPWVNVQIAHLKYIPLEKDRGVTIRCGCRMDKEGKEKVLACVFHAGEEEITEADIFPRDEKFFLIEMEKAGLLTHSVRRTMAVTFCLLKEGDKEGKLSFAKFYHMMGWSFEGSLRQLKNYSGDWKLYDLGRLPGFEWLILSYCEEN